jgi:hypothetical protein
MRDLVYLGPVPPDEPCVQVGDPNYVELSEDECRRYINLIRKVVGPEPQGAKLKVKWSPHDLGSYAEVVCEFDDKYQEAFDYAFRCESEGPQSWDAEAHEEA